MCVFIMSAQPLELLLDRSREVMHHVDILPSKSTVLFPPGYIYPTVGLDSANFVERVIRCPCYHRNW